VTSTNKTRNIVIAVLVATFVFCAALGGFLWWYEGNEKDAAQNASDDLAAALQADKTSGGPDGAGDYLAGIPEYFGPVKDAKTVDVRQVDNYSETTNSANDRSWWTSTIFMHTERGAALLLVTFDDTIDPRDAKIESVRELSPRKVAKGALTATELADAKRGFKARGGKAANLVELQGVFPERSGPAPAVPDAPAEAAPPVDRDAIERQRRKGQRRLKCVQDAQGDIDRLKKCSEL
jgi:hypothetical protein